MTTAPRTRLRPTALAVAVATSVGIILGTSAATAVYNATTPEPSLTTVECATEDSTACFWDADTQGNGQGESFYTDAEGNTYYLPTAEDCYSRVADDATELLALYARTEVSAADRADMAEAYAYRITECGK